MSNGIVVVGGGLAAGRLVSQLRELGFAGAITVLAQEPHLPYERPPLSKGFLLDQQPIATALVHDSDWYSEHDVDVRPGTHVESIDTVARTVVAGGVTLAYDDLVLATGARARTLPLADSVGDRTHYLRTWEDAERLRAALQPGRRLAIVGAGWIGLEVAAAARTHGVDVTVLEVADLPLLRVLGPEVAQIFADLHRSHDVDLRLGVQVAAISATPEGVAITLGDGSTVHADELVVGVGAVPAVELAQAAGITVDNGIRTDAHLRTSAPGVWAIGDVANADHPTLGFPLRVEHWDTAIQHAKVAAANLVGADTVHDALPYFFTDQYDFGMEYVGNPGPDGFDRVVVTGDVAARVFRAYWLRGNLVVAGMHGNDWDAIGRIREVVGTTVDPEHLATTG